MEAEKDEMKNGDGVRSIQSGFDGRVVGYRPGATRVMVMPAGMGRTGRGRPAVMFDLDELEIIGDDAFRSLGDKISAFAKLKKTLKKEQYEALKKIWRRQS